MRITLGVPLYTPPHDQPHFRRFQTVLNLGNWIIIIFETFFDTKQRIVTFEAPKVINFRNPVKTNPILYDFGVVFVLFYIVIAGVTIIN